MTYNQKLLDLLIKKANSQTLAHFYRIKLTDPLEESLFLENWLYPFLGSVLYNDSSANLSRLINHPDLLMIGRVQKDGEFIRDKEASYNLDEIKPLTQFCSSSPWQSKLRITVLFDTHRVNTIVANKLLKTLEEPAENNLILFVTLHNDQLLPTIQSRAITLRLASFENDQDFNFAMQGASLSEMISSDDADALADDYLKYLADKTNSKPNFESCRQIIELSKWFSRSKLFRNSYNERLSRLYLFDKSQ